MKSLLWPVALQLVIVPITDTANAIQMSAELILTLLAVRRQALTAQHQYTLDAATEALCTQVKHLAAVTRTSIKQPETEAVDFDEAVETVWDGLSRQVLLIVTRGGYPAMTLYVCT